MISMINRQKIIGLILALTLVIALFASSTNVARAELLTESDVQLEARSGILIDMMTGEVLYELNADVEYRPASMTKMMTAILVVENMDMKEKTTISENTTHIDGSAIGLKKGEIITIDALLHAMLVYSANDCAYALAEAVAGSEDKFCEMMNKRAKELGCKGTTFKNPHGLEEEGHMSTARDMALIAKKAMEYEEISEITKLTQYEIPKTNKRDAVVVGSTDRLLFDKERIIQVDGQDRHPYYEYAIGIKTGYTPEAGGCLATMSVKDGRKLLSVVMKSSDMGRFADAITLMEYGFNAFDDEIILEAGKACGETSVKFGKDPKIDVVPDRSVMAVVPSAKAKAALASRSTLDTETTGEDAAEEDVSGEAGAAGESGETSGAADQAGTDADVSDDEADPNADADEEDTDADKESKKSSKGSGKSDAEVSGEKGSISSAQAEVDYTVKWKDEIKAPVKKGDKLGTMVISKAGKELQTVNLLAAQDDEENMLGKMFGTKGRAARTLIVFFLILLAIAIIILRIRKSIMQKKKSKRRKARIEAAKHRSRYSSSSVDVRPSRSSSGSREHNRSERYGRSEYGEGRSRHSDEGRSRRSSESASRRSSDSMSHQSGDSRSRHGSEGRSGERSGEHRSSQRNRKHESEGRRSGTSRRSQRERAADFEKKEQRPVHELERENPHEPFAPYDPKKHY